MVLRIGAVTSTVRVDRQQPTSIVLEVTGGNAGPLPPISLSAPDGGHLPWVSVHPSPSVGGASVAVVFDPTRGPRPRPGVYVVDVRVGSADSAAATRLRFEVERHPCLQVSPKPTFSWDPLTNTATVGVSLWSCGNVDLDVTWTARVRHRRLVVEPAVVHVGAGGAAVPVTLSISIPKGKIDVDTEIVLQAQSEAPTVSTVASAGHVPARRRHARPRALGAAALIAAMLVGAVVVARSLDRSDASSVDTTVPVPVPTSDPTSDPPPETSAPAPTTTEATTTTSGTTVVPAPAKIVVEGAARQSLAAAVGGRASATFVVANRGGSDASVRVTADGAPPSFSVAPGACEGALAPDQTCNVVVTFAPTKAGTFTGRFVVTGGSPGGSVELVVDGVGGFVDLVAVVDDPSWSRSGCAVATTECFHFTIRNGGTVGSPATTARASSGSRAVEVRVPPLGPDESIALVADIEAACSPDCSASVTVDPANAIPELSETNNTAGWFTLG